MFKNFFSGKSKAFFGGSTLMLVGTSFFSTSSLNVQAVNAKTVQEGFVKSKTFTYLKARVKTEAIEKIEENWNWNEDNLQNFLKNNSKFFDGAAGDKTELEKLLTLLKFFESHCKNNDINFASANQSKEQCLKEIDKRSGELFANYIENKSLEDLLEIQKLELLYENFKNESVKAKYEKLYSFSEIMNSRACSYFMDFIGFCKFDKEDERKVIADKVCSARALSEVLCHIFSLRKDSKGAFMYYGQILYIVDHGLEVFNLNLKEDFRKCFAEELLVSLNWAVASLNGKSSVATKIVRSTITSYNKAGLEGLKKVLNLWSEKNKDNFVNDMIEKELNGENVDKGSLFEQIDKIVDNVC